VLHAHRASNSAPFDFRKHLLAHGFFALCAYRGRRMDFVCHGVLHVWSMSDRCASSSEGSRCTRQSHGLRARYAWSDDLRHVLLP